MSQEIVDTYRKEVQYRVRHDRIDKTGTVTLRYRSRLRHKPVLLLSPALRSAS